MSVRDPYDRSVRKFGEIHPDLCRKRLSYKCLRRIIFPAACASLIGAGDRADRRWTLHGAWVKILEYDDLQRGNTEKSIEELTIAYQYWSA